MTPDLLTLASAYTALPGAPAQDHAGAVVATGLRVPERRYRTPEGILWAWDDETTRWLPSLDDDATGGVMLGMLPPGWLVYRREADGRWEVSRPDGEHQDEGATLAEAVARVAVALGGAR